MRLLMSLLTATLITTQAPAAELPVRDLVYGTRINQGQIRTPFWDEFQLLPENSNRIGSLDPGAEALAAAPYKRVDDEIRAYLQKECKGNPSVPDLYRIAKISYDKCEKTCSASSMSRSHRIAGAGSEMGEKCQKLCSKVELQQRAYVNGIENGEARAEAKCQKAPPKKFSPHKQDIDFDNPAYYRDDADSDAAN